MNKCSNYGRFLTYVIEKCLLYKVLFSCMFLNSSKYDFDNVISCLNKHNLIEVVFQRALFLLL